MYFNVFHPISAYFSLFQYISVHFNIFQSISAYFNVLQSEVHSSELSKMIVFLIYIAVEASQFVWFWCSCCCKIDSPELYTVKLLNTKLLNANSSHCVEFLVKLILNQLVANESIRNQLMMKISFEEFDKLARERLARGDLSYTS